jgi:phosphoacetylglucosamine mutase
VPQAAEFDIGIYFEANGHGTVLFNPTILPAIKAIAANKADPIAEKAASRLLALNQLVNQVIFESCLHFSYTFFSEQFQAVGDAISDILLVEVVLASLKLTLPSWNAFYSDLPSYQVIPCNRVGVALIFACSQK